MLLKDGRVGVLQAMRVEKKHVENVQGGPHCSYKEGPSTPRVVGPHHEKKLHPGAHLGFILKVWYFNGGHFLHEKNCGFEELVFFWWELFFLVSRGNSRSSANQKIAMEDI